MLQAHNGKRHKAGPKQQLKAARSARRRFDTFPILKPISSLDLGARPPPAARKQGLNAIEPSASLSVPMLTCRRLDVGEVRRGRRREHRRRRPRQSQAATAAHQRRRVPAAARQPAQAGRRVAAAPCARIRCQEAAGRQQVTCSSVQRGGLWSSLPQILMRPVLRKCN